MKKYLSLFVVLAMALGMNAGLARAAGPVCTVPGDYATIQEAVNDVGCTTINVAAGTYAEQVAVNRSVVLNGANAGIAGNGVRGAESIVSGSDTSSPFVITANDVTIDGFTVENGSNGSFFSGIWSQTGTLNSKIVNNVITHNGIGVWAQCGGNCLVSANLFDANNKPGPSGGAAISADSTNGLTINNNEFKNHTQNNPILFQAAGADAHLNDVVSNNSIHDNANGGSAIYALALKDASFTGNNITADTSDIRLGGGNHTVTVANNILHSTVGVNVVDDGFGLGLNTGIVVNRNSLTGHSVAGVDNSQPGQTSSVNATCNWWGAANGPSTVGTGSGDPVSVNVTFSPWLTTSDLVNDPCNGTAVTLTSVTVTPATATISVKEKDDGKDKHENDGDNASKDGSKDDKNKKDDNENVPNTVQLTATPLDQNGVAFVGATTTFTSGDPTVATVDSVTGLVTGVKAGTATVTATSTSGNITVTGTSVITVVKEDDKDKDKKDEGDKNKGDNKPPVVNANSVSGKESKKGKH